MTFIIILPLAIVIQMLRLPIISILFRGGAFDEHSISITSDILSGYALAIIGQSIFMISLRFFMAIRKILIPMMIVLFSSVVNIAADYLLVSVYGAAGLGVGAAVGSICNGVLLIIFLNRELELHILKKAAVMARILAASLPVVVLVILFQKLWEWVDPRRNTLLNLSYGIVVFAVCVLVYLLSLKVWKVYDIRRKSI
jgi:peptidoglycan biosynthesis protein MviN/MurJ (putative lipid II flippase)